MDNRHALLEDMAIKGPNGYLLEGVFMSGRISSVTKNYVGVDLPAAEGTLRFPKEKAKLLANDHKQCEMFVVFDKEIKKIVGLRMSGGFRPKDYYDELDEAKSHVAKITKKTSNVAKGKSETASANSQLTVGAEPDQNNSKKPSQPPAPKTVTTTPTTTPSDTSTTNSVNAGSLAILANAMTAEESEISACNPVPETNMNPQPSNPTPTPTPTPENQSSQATSTTTSISNTESSPAASPAVRRSSRGHGAGATVRVPENAAEYINNIPTGLPEANASASECSDSSAPTDDGREEEVEHAATVIKWKPSKAWLELKRKKKLSELEEKLGETEWIAPANRDQVISCDSGPEQDIYFHVDGRRTAVDLFLDALPVDKFWMKLAKNSLAYCKSKIAEGDNTRHIDYKWFTAANYMRVFAAVIMRGLVKCRDDPDFFAGANEGLFSRTGAEEVVGLTLNQYQQLLRFMSIVPPGSGVGPSHDDFDKLYKVRPFVKLLQQCFARWCTPGKNNAMDEAGFDSRHQWMRTFNPSKPSKYFMEALEACDSDTHFCWGLIVTESATKTVLNRHRAATGSQRARSKFHKVNRCNPCARV